jgi:NTE family protein
VVTTLTATPPVAEEDELAIVLTGGGARGAYQVGVLRWIARHYPQVRIPILTGVSAGAVNVGHLAGHHGTFTQAVMELAGLWRQLTLDNVFELAPSSLAWTGLRWSARLLSGGLVRGPNLQALLDTQPLREYLEEAYAAVDGEITGIDYNLRRGALKAVAVSTTDYSTGESAIFVHGRGIRPWAHRRRRVVQTRLTVEHVMASSAIPLFFPAVRIGRSWYGDGGFQLTAPLGPALHLGARRILAISTRYEAPGERRRKTVIGYPPPATILGLLLNAPFLDYIEEDGARLLRFNSLLAKIPPERREGMRMIDFLSIRPSRDLSRLAKKHENKLPAVFRFLTRGLGTKQSASPDLLSMLAFVPEYMEQIMAQGDRDAERNGERLDALLAGTGPGARAIVEEHAPAAGD